MRVLPSKEEWKKSWVRDDLFRIIQRMNEVYSLWSV